MEMTLQDRIAKELDAMSDADLMSAMIRSYCASGQVDWSRKAMAARIWLKRYPLDSLKREEQIRHYESARAIASCG